MTEKKRRAKNLRSKQWRAEHPAQVKANNKRWRKKNHKKKLAAQRRWAAENPTYGRDYYLAHRDEILAQRRAAYTGEDKEKAVAYSRRWRKENPERKAAANKAWHHLHPTYDRVYHFANYDGEAKRKYYRKHRAAKLAYQKAYYQRHRAEILAKQRIKRTGTDD